MGVPVCKQCAYLCHPSSCTKSSSHLLYDNVRAWLCPCVTLQSQWRDYLQGCPSTPLHLAAALTALESMLGDTALRPHARHCLRPAHDPRTCHTWPAVMYRYAHTLKTLSKDMQTLTLVMPCRCGFPAGAYAYPACMRVCVCVYMYVCVCRPAGWKLWMRV